MSEFGYDTYLSPSTWRYGSAEMRTIWSERHKRILMRRVWVALATAQHEAGLVSAEQLTDLRAHAADVDIDRALAIERETRHDVMAEIRTYAEQCPIGGGIIHWGATSADVNDNVNALRLREAARLVAQRLRALLVALADKIEATAHTPVMAHTHIQPAEPTTLGYRFAVYAQDVFEDWQDVTRLVATLRGKGFKGAVGTQASYAELLRDTQTTPEAMEARAMAELDLPCFPITTQTYTRRQDLRVMTVLASVGATLHKLAMDFRVLQSPPFGEWAEPFGRKQVGSSAMPFKRNPINMENVCSLARFVAAMPAVAWDNASQAILERSLDDSANRRVMFPEAFLLTDEIVRRMIRVISGMVLDEQAMARNLATYGPFAATERVLMALVAAGADRQTSHEWLREHSLAAWATLREGAASNPLLGHIVADPRMGRYLTPTQLRALMHADAHTGTAAARALALAAQIRSHLETPATA